MDKNSEDKKRRIIDNFERSLPKLWKKARIETEAIQKKENANTDFNNKETN
ncbi:hypothetical protein [Paenibacillus campinasensis]|uniref:hypothetical protein n=1 Tax=Paenibacillus campinasensis TaxID=66347 RepID=UPI0015C89316|nr:hypothetical protein [Paenibacillus campinasensis]